MKDLVENLNENLGFKKYNDIFKVFKFVNLKLDGGKSVGDSYEVKLKYEMSSVGDNFLKFNEYKYVLFDKI